MKKTKIIIAVLVIALIIAAAVNASKGSSVSGLSGSANSGDKETVTIGLSLPLSGPVAFLGEPAKKSAELALTDAKTAAGAKGLKYDYKLAFEDDAFDPTKAATAASKLINIDHSVAVISFGSGTGNAINAIAEKSKTVQFSLASDPTVAKGEYNYIHWTPAASEGDLLGKELVRRGYKKVSIISANHPGPLAIRDSVKKALAGTDIEIVTEDITNLGEKDFRTIIQKIKKANPDIVVLEMFSPEIEIAAKQMNEQKVNIPRTSVETFEWSSEPELFEGEWFVSDSIVPGFASKFKAAYGTDALSGSSYVYDLVSFLITEQERQAAPIKPADLPSIIKKSGDWNSPVFGKIKIDADGFFLTEPTVKKIVEGKAVVAK